MPSHSASHPIVLSNCDQLGSALVFDGVSGWLCIDQFQMRKISKSSNHLNGVAKMMTYFHLPTHETVDCATTSKKKAYSRGKSQPLKSGATKSRSLTITAASRPALTTIKQQKSHQSLEQNKQKVFSVHTKSKGKILKSGFQKSLVSTPTSTPNSVYISKVKEKFQSKYLPDRSYKLWKEDVNKCKVDYVELYSVKNALRTGESPPHNKAQDMHDFSDHYIVSKGNILIRGSARISEASNISFSESSQSNMPSALNIDHIPNSQLLSLTKKKSKESQFLLFMHTRKLQCCTWKSSDSVAKALFSCVLGPIRLEQGKVSGYGFNSDNGSIPPYLLKKSKKKVTLTLTNKNELIFFSFLIQRREKFDRRKSVHYKQKMLVAYENYCEEDFRKYLGKYIRQCLHVWSTPLGHTLQLKQQARPCPQSKKISIHESEHLQIQPDNNSQFYTVNRTMNSQATHCKIAHNLVFVSFIKIKNKYFLCLVKRSARTSESVTVRLMHQLTQNGQLPLNHQIKCNISGQSVWKQALKGQQVRLGFNRVMHGLIQWTTAFVGFQVYGLDKDDLCEYRMSKRSKSEQFYQQRSPQAFKTSPIVSESVQSAFKSFTYLIQSSNSQVNRYPCLRKKWRKTVVVNQTEQRHRKRVHDQIAGGIRKRSESGGNVKSKGYHTHIKELGDDAEQPSQFMIRTKKKSSKSNNFFKYRSSFDYGVRKNTKSILKSHFDCCYFINLVRFTIIGACGNRKIHLSINNQEQRQRFLILNLPYHLDSKISNKFETSIIKKSLKSAESTCFRFSLQMPGSCFHIFQCLQDKQSNIMRISSLPGRKTDFYRLPSSVLPISVEGYKYIAGSLYKNRSLTYYRFQPKNSPLYEIVYKKIHKIGGGIYLVFTIVTIPAMRYSFIRTYCSRSQTTHVAELPQFDKRMAIQLAMNYQAVLSKTHFQDDLTNEKARIQSKNRRLYENIIFSSFKQTNKCILENKLRRDRTIRQRSRHGHDSHKSLHGGKQMAEEISKQFYKDKFNREFMISIVKSGKMAKVLILQAGKFMRFEFDVGLGELEDIMSTKSGLKKLSIKKIDIAKVSRHAMPIISVIDGDQSCCSQNLLRNLKQLFYPNQGIHQKLNGKNIRFRQLHHQKLAIICSQDCQMRPNIKKQFFIYKPATQTLQKVQQKATAILQVRILQKHSKINMKLLRRILTQL